MSTKRCVSGQRKKLRKVQSVEWDPRATRWQGQRVKSSISPYNDTARKEFRVPFSPFSGLCQSNRIRIRILAPQPIGEQCTSTHVIGPNPNAVSRTFTQTQRVVNTERTVTFGTMIISWRVSLLYRLLFQIGLSADELLATRSCVSTSEGLIITQSIRPLFVCLFLYEQFSNCICTLATGTVR